jgi:hypothetical protein
MIGMAVLALVLSLAIQFVVLRRRAAELERWGRSLRDRERYLHQLDNASGQAALDPEDALRENADAADPPAARQRGATQP